MAQSEDFGPSPFRREWEPRRDARDSGKFKVTIMTWNILADGLNGTYGGKSKTFAGVPEEFLLPQHRVPLFIKEVRRWNCDIICFQEFDFYKVGAFIEEMEAMGYAEGAQQRKRWSPCITVDSSLAPDGVAIFYKRDLFDCQDKHTTDQLQHKRWIERELNAHPEKDGFISLSQIRGWMNDDADRILELLTEELPVESSGEGWSFAALTDWVGGRRPPVSAGVRLVPKADPSVSLYVMTTHLVASKKQVGEEQRHSELNDLLTEPRHVELMGTSHPFLCFDMNASYEAINGYIPRAYPLLTGSTPVNANLLGADPPPATAATFKSATRDYLNGDREMEWTSWKKRNNNGVVEHSKYGVDFVFYPPEGWNVTRVSGLPSEEDMNNFARDANLEHFQLPNEKYPSDHLAICAELQIA